MIAAPLLLALSARAAEAGAKYPLPLEARWSGALYCRFPVDAPLKRALLLTRRGENGVPTVVLRGMDARGVIADERALTLGMEEDRSGDPADPRVSRRKHPKPAPVRLTFLSDGESPVSGTLIVEPGARVLTLRVEKTSAAALFGGACSGTLAREKSE